MAQTSLVSYEIEHYIHDKWRFSFIDAEKLEDLQLGSYDLDLYEKSWRVMKIMIEDNIIADKSIVDKSEIQPIFYEAEQRRTDTKDAPLRGLNA